MIRPTRDSQSDRERSINPALFAHRARTVHASHYRGGMEPKRRTQCRNQMRAPETLLTGEEFMRQDTEFRHSYELVDGRLVPLPVTFDDSRHLHDRGSSRRF